MYNYRMFNRKIEKELLIWKESQGRKPLVIRGARQTGKTTLIKKLGQSFNSFVELNLERDDVRKIFSQVRDVKEILKDIEAFTGKKITPGETLLFLDEIQNSINAIKLLRFFYEDLPALHVVSAGSLLEVRMQREGWSFPVGRISFLYLYPATFEEFLSAVGEDVLLQFLLEIKIGQEISAAMHDKLFSLLADYMIVGGMPEAVKRYVQNKDFLSVRHYQEELLAAFKEDFVKYARHAQVEPLKQVWERVPFEIGQRIKYSKMAGTRFSSWQLMQAFEILHEAMLVERIFPTTSTRLPLVRKAKTAPKTMFLDIGLCTCVLSLTREQIKEKIINPIYGGALFEELVGQELLALDFYSRGETYFWVREESGTSSEVDFLFQEEGKLVPIEVKAGKQGTLKSLHQFLSKSKLALGVRLYSGSLRLEENRVKLPEGTNLHYKLLSMPFYLLFRLPYFCKAYN